MDDYEFISDIINTPEEANAAMESAVRASKKSKYTSLTHKGTQYIIHKDDVEGTKKILGEEC